MEPEPCSKRMTVLPMRRGMPGSSHASRTRTPATQVPLAEPRSRSKKPVSLAMISQCVPLAAVSVSCRSQMPLRPMVMRSLAMSSRVPCSWPVFDDKAALAKLALGRSAVDEHRA